MCNPLLIGSAYVVSLVRNMLIGNMNLKLGKNLEAGKRHGQAEFQTIA